MTTVIMTAASFLVLSFNRFMWIGAPLLFLYFAYFV